MSSISLSLKMLLAGSALAGLTLLACGEDSGGGKETDKDEDNVQPGKTRADAGPKKDAGGGNRPPVATGAVEGEDCTGIGGMCDNDQCDEPPCFAQCVSGTYGECRPSKDLIGQFTGDGGLPSSVKIDGGSISVKDGSVSIKVGDAEVDIPATACPDSLTCGDLTAFGVPVKYCAEGLFPPKCTTAKDCADMGLKLATCAELPLAGLSCLQVCE